MSIFRVLDWFMTFLRLLLLFGLVILLAYFMPKTVWGLLIGMIISTILVIIFWDIEVRKQKYGK